MTLLTFHVKFFVGDKNVITMLPLRVFNGLDP